jgi:hypothetical protein
MVLYHGSSRLFDIIKRKQPIASPVDRKEKGKKSKAIFLTPSLCFAMFFACKPEKGGNMVSMTKKVVLFEKEIDKEGAVYIYVVDNSEIQKFDKKWNNPYEISVYTDEIPVISVEKHVAGEIFELFRVVYSPEEFRKLVGAL